MRFPSLLIGLFAIAPAAFAQWSNDPTVNLPVADASGSQVQPKVQPTPDGGVYISWFDGPGFDVRVQKLDALGNELLPHEGILVADRGFSSTVDYDLDIDAAGNALLTFRDDRGTGTQITATLVTPDGMQPWGPNGVTLTNTTAFVANPKIEGTSDGGSVVAWTQDAEAMLQKLDSNGLPLWTADVVLTPSVGTYTASDLHSMGTDVLLSFIHQTGTITAPKHILAQKFDVDGNLLWDSGHVAVFDGGSLQIGNYPSFLPDGSGGGVFSWYDVAGSNLQCSVQHILTDGSEVFAHDGLVVSTTPGRDRVSPDIAYDANSNEIYAYWNEQGAAGAEGVYGQKFDGSGSRLWTESGLEILALAVADVTSVQALLGGPGAFVFWNVAPSFGQDQLFGANASGDAGGTINFSFDFSMTPSGKSRLVSANSTANFGVVVWQDDRNGDDDIYAQNINPDGSLGNLPTGIADEFPTTLADLRAWPNPTNGVVHLEFETPESGQAELAIFDVLGRRVDGRQVSTHPGRNLIRWNARSDAIASLASGVYLVQLQQNGRLHSLPLVIIN